MLLLWPTLECWKIKWNEHYKIQRNGNNKGKKRWENWKTLQKLKMQVRNIQKYGKAAGKQGTSQKIVQKLYWT